MERIKNNGALWRPDAACDSHAGCHLGLACKQAGVEECPEPCHEEHDFRGNEHQHAVAQMQTNHRCVITCTCFSNHITPPHKHGVEHKGKAQ